MHSHVLSHVFTEAGTIFYSFATAYLQSLSTVYWHVGQKNCCLNEKCQLLLQAVTTKKKKILDSELLFHDQQIFAL